MAKMYGKKTTRKDLAARVSRMGQVAGIRPVTLQGGAEEGVKAAQFRTGSGLNFTVGISRGLDIFEAEFCGRALAWLSPGGFAAPGFYEPEGLGWLRSFGGGLLTTCGLTYLGAPDTDEGEALGLHGRYSNLPANNVRITQEWQKDDYLLSIEGDITEALPVAGDFIRLKRKISAGMGKSTFRIEDTVENFGYKSVPHMLLYHFNLGWPLLDVGARVVTTSLETRPRDAAAEVEADQWAEVLPPTPGFEERVYYHKPGAAADGRARAALINPDLDDGLGLYIAFQPEQLPRLVQWKMCAAGNYVMGLEPANCWVGGRGQARAAGDLQFLEPGEVRSYDLEVGLVSGRKGIARLEEQITGKKA